MAPHRDDLEAAQQRIRALEDRIEELEIEDAPAAPASDARPKRAPARKAIAEMEAAGLAQAAKAQSDMAAILAKARRKTRDGLVVVFGTTLLVFVFWALDYLVAMQVDPTREAMGRRALFANEGVVFAAAAAAVVASFASTRIYAPAPLFYRADDPRADEPRLSRRGWATLTVVALVAHVLVLVLGNR